MVVKEFYPKGAQREIEKRRVRGFGGGVVQLDKAYHVVPPDKHKKDWNKVVDRFLQEGQILVQLRNNSPNVVYVIEHFEANNTGYIIMEHLSGQNMDMRVRISSHGRLKVSEALSYMHQVGQSLDLLHKKGWLHLDVKPSNIMFQSSNNHAEQPTPVLIDFGSACKYQIPMPQDRYVFGSEIYSAPELQFGTGYNPGPYSDVYSLAATCFFCLTGRHHKGQRRHEAWTDLRLILKAEGHADLEEILESALVDDCESRTRRVDELVSAFKYHMGSDSIGHRSQKAPTYSALEPRPGGLFEEIVETKMADSLSTSRKDATTAEDPKKEETQTVISVAPKPRFIPKELPPDVVRRRGQSRIAPILWILGVSAILVGAALALAQGSIELSGTSIPLWMAYSVVVVIAALLIALGTAVFRNWSRPASLIGLNLVSTLHGQANQNIQLSGRRQILLLNGAQIELLADTVSGYPLLRVISSTSDVLVDDTTCPVGPHAPRVELNNQSTLQVGNEEYILIGVPRRATGKDRSRK
ncbi:MAG: serine/threonine protein kinase [Chloroflexota bacterium]|nr:serine/threonine protein kinase [Chloroflexota bacterium]